MLATHWFDVLCQGIGAVVVCVAFYLALLLAVVWFVWAMQRAAGSAAVLPGEGFWQTVRRRLTSSRGPS